MATLGQSYLDLIDLYKQHDDEALRQTAVIIEMLAETNPILDDAIAVECNLGVKHRTTIRTGLPSVTWGQLYKGISQSKGETAQVDDTTGFAEALSSVDTRLLDLAANPNAVRMSEARAFLEAISQEVASRIFYGNVVTDPEQFTGLAPRFNSLSAPNGGQIVDAGGTGSDNTSIWIVTWGENQTHLIYPKGSRAGIDRKDKGEQRVLDGDGNPYYVKEEMFRQNVGLCVRDWRQVVRIANIDVSELMAGNVDIYKWLRKGFWKLNKHRLSGGKIAIYCNADVCEALDADSTPTTGTSASYVRLRPAEVDGKEVMAYRTFPVRQCDAILGTEARVT
ncbi:major capsid protein [Methyloceanibacter caenitepidi]|uniref:Major capsid protein n=1 Tax=Methyloceanibacter caenitepidi TaxID=1384459 RepID=A0A0A8K1U5_9HYPH|nr:hypothetical protein [Methyloceanibacter caenitepidi]BAQ16918.1 hypothetical protein GL4_1462 [Methyloceanibacter caenitepidi]